MAANVGSRYQGYSRSKSRARPLATYTSPRWGYKFAAEQTERFLLCPLHILFILSILSKNPCSLRGLWAKTSRLPFAGPFFSESPIKPHHFASFEASFTRLLPYTQKMCSRPRPIQSSRPIHQSINPFPLYFASADFRYLKRSPLVEMTRVVLLVATSSRVCMERMKLYSATASGD